MFGSRFLVHSQQKNFLNQSYQKLHYRPTATSIINTKLLHIFLTQLVITFTSGSDFNLKRAHYYLPNVSFFFILDSCVNKKHLINKLLQFPFFFSLTAKVFSMLLILFFSSDIVQCKNVFASFFNHVKALI